MRYESIILVMVVLPFLFLGGCVKKPSEETASISFKCTLPSKPGVVEADVLDFPSEIIVEKNQDTSLTLSVLFTNTITSKPNNKDKITVEWSYIPNMGETKSDKVDLDVAGYDPTSGEVFETTYPITIDNIKIPAEMAEFGYYKAIFKWRYNTSTDFLVPICLAYNPTITKIEKSVMACDPLALPQPCYSAAPVTINVREVKPMGQGNTAVYKITFEVIDNYGGVCKKNNKKIVKISNFYLKIDHCTIPIDGTTDAIKCTAKKGSELYLSVVNTITCYIYLGRLKNACKDKAYIDGETFKVGKSAIIGMKLDYEYCMEKELGPSKLLVIS